MSYNVRTLTLVLVATACFVRGQEPSTPVTPPPAPTAPVQPPADKRILGVMPNYRTAEMMVHYEPLTIRQKLTIAAKDTFDWPLYILGGAYAVLYQAENQNPSFGQGLKGFAHRYVTSYADQAMGNMLAEGVMPSLLHEDPRYFRMSRGPVHSRLFYSMTRIFVTKTDTGGTRFNFSELLGNSIAVGVSNSYYPDTRTVSDNVQKLSMQLGTDMASNLLKEFWPDIKRRLHHQASEGK